MLKRISVGIAGLVFVLATAGLARSQTATQQAEQKTASAAQKTGEYLTDTEITTAVKTKFLADKKVSGTNISVETNDGVVTLTGPVDSAAEKAQAIKLARETHGVKRVISKLMIEKKPAASNPSLTDKTESAAKKTGEATENAAKKTGGAVKGTSGTVAKDTENAAKDTGRFFSDAEITTAVKTKLAADSGVHSMDVHVDTDKGVVTLTGSVRSDAEKTDAVAIARKTMGVKSVVNKLTVK
ncbi:MAG TPA: BON domain-containing protein [Vicinamibacterales bacterium]|nr:BON domain-containing protein [Vicinamibacterales bacterium]